MRRIDDPRPKAILLEEETYSCARSFSFSFAWQRPWIGDHLKHQEDNCQRLVYTGRGEKERALIHRCVRVRLFFSVASHLFAFTLPPAAISRRFVDGCPPCQALKEGDEAWLFRPTQLPWWFSPARNNTGERARVSALWKAGRNYFW